MANDIGPHAALYVEHALRHRRLTPPVVDAKPMTFTRTRLPSLVPESNGDERDDSALRRPLAAACGVYPVSVPDRVAPVPMANLSSLLWYFLVAMGAAAGAAQGGLVEADRARGAWAALRGPGQRWRLALWPYVETKARGRGGKARQFCVPVRSALARLGEYQATGAVPPERLRRGSLRRVFLVV